MLIKCEKKKIILLCGEKLGYDSCPYLISLDRKNANDLGIRILLVKDN
jgi:hypothetical protein